MAGTLTISTLSDGTNSTSATNCIQGSAKAWVNWTGSSGAINASYNVSSVTRTATGTYTVNFTNAFSSTNYATAFGGNSYTASTFPIITENFDSPTRTTTACGVYCGNRANGSLFDGGVICASFFNS